MRSILVLFISLIVISCQQEPPKFVTMEEDVAILASDSLGGRETGTDYERMAAAYISQRFEDIGLSPKGTDGFYQDFTFKPSLNPHEQAKMTDGPSDGTVTGRNVVGFIDNGATGTVIIGAHYDHLGMGGVSSLHREGEAIHNGADDNASGVAVMIHLAKAQFISFRVLRHGSHLAILLLFFFWGFYCQP